MAVPCRCSLMAHGQAATDRFRLGKNLACTATAVMGRGGAWSPRRVTITSAAAPDLPGSGQPPATQRATPS
jgi:hypothetical protein